MGLQPLLSLFGNMLMGKRQSVSVFKIVGTSACNITPYVHPLLSSTTKIFEDQDTI